MLKRLLLLVGLLSLVSAPVMAAGTLPGISMSQQLDSLGKPLNGGKLYLIQAGTTSTPQNCYQDSGLTIAWPNPITLDAAGRIPQLFCADGSIKIRLTNSAGVQQLVADNLLVVGPSGGGGGGGTVDPTTILTTGDFKQVYGTGVLTGFVRCNGRTIGSATSGATERANADTQALFQYLWGADSNLVVSGGRGVSAAADWAANKTITLPDCRGKALAGLDDMGNSVAGTYSGVSFFGGTPTTLGALVGTARRTLTAAQLPANIPNSGTFSAIVSFGGSYIVGQQSTTAAVSGGATVGGVGYNSVPLVGSVTGSTSVNINPGGGSAFDTVSPYMLVTNYIKL